jgi:diguanylate cyclase (GGDEF)-like protein
MAEDVVRTVVRTAAELTASLREDDVLRAAVHNVGQATAAASCTVYDYSATYDLLTLRAAWSSDGDDDLRELVGASFGPADRPCLFPAVRERRTIETHVNDAGLSQALRDELWSDLTIVATPLGSGSDGDLLGLLVVTEKSIRHFSRGERELLEALAALVGPALANARLFSRQADQNRYLAALLESSRALSSVVVLDQVLETVASKTAEALDVVRCRIWEYDQTADRFDERTDFIDPAYDGSLPEPASPDDPSSVAHRAVATGELASERLVGEQPSGHQLLRRKALPAQTQTRIALPLLFAGAPVGVIVLVEPRGEREFSVTELDLARALAEQAAAAIQNAHLYHHLEEQAITDGLTGLANHRHFYDRLHEEVARARRYRFPLSLLMLDIDDFKRFNDAHGHQAGDEALRLVGAILKLGLRQKIDLAARYGGEEFTAILPNTALGGATVAGTRLANEIAELVSAHPSGDGSAEGAADVGERLRQSVADASATAAAILPARITVSVGVAELGEEHGADELVAAADAALYVAKRTGKNKVCVTP